MVLGMEFLIVACSKLLAKSLFPILFGLSFLQGPLERTVLAEKTKVPSNKKIRILLYYFEIPIP